MDADQALVATTVAVIVAVVLASGPLVGTVDLTPERATDAGADVPLGNGTAAVSVVSVPDTVRLDRGEFGANAYAVRVPNATVAVATAEGRPFLNYKLRIETLGHTTSALYEIGDRANDRIALTLDPRPIAPDEVNRTEYAGELVVVLTDDRGRRVLYRGTITVEVAR